MFETAYNFTNLEYLVILWNSEREATSPESCSRKICDVLEIGRAFSRV